MTKRTRATMDTTTIRAVPKPHRLGLNGLATHGKNFSHLNALLQALATAGHSASNDWHKLWHGTQKLDSARVGYRVRYKSKISGGRKPASIKRHGAELSYLDEDLVSQKSFFLCEKCHTTRTPACLFDLDHGTAHIKLHLRKAHQIDPNTGLIPPTVVRREAIKGLYYAPYYLAPLYFLVVAYFIRI
ncbi:hypothetical protein BU23DRAFT_566547 [Bimuria novae-zelandiae CBS 107.79]|uniref:Uncharacterized protein n=1 Tax=Bimuria novae-zelandiae CBS 107.79 TaxID=1447943 RepID=A0A6A5VE98_9PLEO|nr:hypothetical protein BU23DRAFT_566547 [Bimuria novae-zelandiae CBS 107.79]